MMCEWRGCAHLRKACKPNFYWWPALPPPPFFLSRPWKELALLFVAPGPLLFPPPEPLRLIDGLDFSFTGFSAGAFFAPLRAPAVLTLWCSVFCSALALAEAVEPVLVLIGGTVLRAGFSRVGLTLKALPCCWAHPPTLIPTTATATTSENLIIDESPVPISQARQLRATYDSDARTLPSGALSSMVNPGEPESTRRNRNK